jgi:predicted enzyme related to lactoylglutathione lyase
VTEIRAAAIAALVLALPASAPAQTSAHAAPVSASSAAAAIEELRARGLEFVDAPTEQLYGIDAAFRDPSGNHFRLTQLKEMPAEYQTAAAAGSSSAS